MKEIPMKTNVFARIAACCFAAFAGVALAVAPFKQAMAANDVVKTPAESKMPGDYYKIMAVIPGEQAFTTKAESRCALWK
jgi:hypothetical protein